MRKRSTLVLAGLAATLALGALVSSASAGRLSISASTFSATWTAFSLSGANSEVACPLTLEGSFHSRTIRKVADSLIGAVTRARVSEGGQCIANGGVSGLIIILPTLPWRINYRSFAGTLPNITSVRLAILGFDMLARTTSAGRETSCLYQGNAERPVIIKMNRETGTGIVSNLQVEEANRIIRVSGEMFTCPAEGVVRGTTNLFAPTAGSPTRVTITLI